MRAPNLLDMAAYPKLFAGAANGAAGEEEQYALTGEWVHCILRALLRSRARLDDG